MAQGFLGDNLDAPRLVVNSGDIDYLTLEYLAELTLSILARARDKNPAAGYAGDFLYGAAESLPGAGGEPRLKIVTNAGGMNPIACSTGSGGSAAGCGDR